MYGEDRSSIEADELAVAVAQQGSKLRYKSLVDLLFRLVALPQFTEWGRAQPRPSPRAATVLLGSKCTAVLLCKLADASLLPLILGFAFRRMTEKECFTCKTSADAISIHSLENTDGKSDGVEDAVWYFKLPRELSQVSMECFRGLSSYLGLGGLASGSRDHLAVAIVHSFQHAFPNVLHVRFISYLDSWVHGCDGAGMVQSYNPCNQQAQCSACGSFGYVTGTKWRERNTNVLLLWHQMLDGKDEDREPLPMQGESDSGIFYFFPSVLTRFNELD